MSKTIKTEHNGSKKGNGAFYGRKQEAKEFSNKNRRQMDRLISQGNFNEGDLNAFDFDC